MCRPVSRLRVALLKYLSAVIYTFVLVEFIGISALAAGIVYRGYGGLFVFAPLEGVFALFERGLGLRLFLEAMPLLALSMVSISSLGFLFSCCNMKPAAASIVTLSIIFLDFIFHGIPYFESLKGLLHYHSSFRLDSVIPELSALVANGRRITLTCSDWMPPASFLAPRFFTSGI